MNHNTYVVIVLFALPFLLALMLAGYKNASRLLPLLAASIFVLMVNGSRGGLICLFIYCMVFVFFYIRKADRLGVAVRRLMSIIVVGAVGMAGFLIYFEGFFVHLFFRLTEVGLFADSARSLLIYKGIMSLPESYFLGFGVGSEIGYFQKVGAPVWSSHNLLVEIAVQYGVLLTVGFFWSLLNIFRPILLGKSGPAEKYLLVSFFLSLGPLFVINSGYLLMPSLWAWLASLFAMGSARVRYGSIEGLGTRVVARNLSRRT